MSPRRLIDDVEQVCTRDRADLGADEKSLAVLQALYVHDGRMTTTDIRAAAPALSNDDCKYRREQLSSRGHVRVTTQGHDEKGRALPAIWRLTDEGRTALESGEYGVPGSLYAPTEVERLEARIDELEELLEHSLGWMGLAEVYLKATRRVFEEEFDLAFEQVLAEVDEETEE